MLSWYQRDLLLFAVPSSEARLGAVGFGTILSSCFSSSVTTFADFFPAPFSKSPPVLTQTLCGWWMPNIILRLLGMCRVLTWSCLGGVCAVLTASRGEVTFKKLAQVTQPGRGSWALKTALRLLRPPSFQLWKSKSPQKMPFCPAHPRPPLILPDPPSPAPGGTLKQASDACSREASPLPTYNLPTCSLSSFPWTLDSWPSSLALIFASARSGLATRHIPLWLYGPPDFVH